MSIPEGTFYMFSCNKCPAAETRGTLPEGVKLIRVADSIGKCVCFILRMSEKDLQVPQGYNAFSPDKLITQLSQEEGKQQFGPHACAADSTVNQKKENPSEGKVARNRGLEISPLAVVGPSGNMRLLPKKKSV